MLEGDAIGRDFGRAHPTNTRSGCRTGLRYVADVLFTIGPRPVCCFEAIQPAREMYTMRASWKYRKYTRLLTWVERVHVAPADVDFDHDGEAGE